MITTLHLIALSAALLLVVSGVAKIRAPQPAAAMVRGLRMAALRPLARPSAMRVVALVELLAGAAFAGVGGRGAAVVLAGVYGGFVAVVGVSMARGSRASCGCFGSADAPLGRGHLGVDAVACAAAVVAAVRPAGPWGGLTSFGTLPSVVAAGQVLVLAALGYLCITALPALAAARRAVLPRS